MYGYTKIPVRYFFDKTECFEEKHRFWWKKTEKIVMDR